MNNKGYTLGELLIELLVFSGFVGLVYILAHFVIKFW